MEALNVAVVDGSRTRTGAQLLVDALVTHGVDLIFGVPGESYLRVLDALLDTDDALRFITCRQEGGAAYMADAYGKLTGRPGICFVTRGPGACNAAIGLHTAHQDSTPMILFIGQVSTDVIEREAFQEIDYRRMFGPVCKWVAQIDRADRVAEFVSRAFHTAVSGRPGPVVLVLPEDMQEMQAPAARLQPFTKSAAHPGPSDLMALHSLLGTAERPLLVVGGGDWTDKAAESLKTFVHKFGLPVAASFRRQDIFDNNDPHYVGDLSPGMNPGLASRVRDADLIIALGDRLGEMPTAGYTLLDIPLPRQRLVHIHPDPQELGRVYQPTLAINAGVEQFLDGVGQIQAVEGGWRDWLESARADYEAWQRSTHTEHGGLNLSEVISQFRKAVPEDTIVTNGAGNYAVWVHRFHRYARRSTQLAPTSGAMGYGVPAAIAAKLVHPDRIVVCFAGDGCFMMNGQELATAAQYGAKVVFIIVNNGMYGTIRLHQERTFPSRVSGTELMNPDFAVLASSYGFHSEVVSATHEFDPALERALAAPTSAVIELRTNPDAITPQTTITALRSFGR